jgi:hypothetical protein
LLQRLRCGFDVEDELGQSAITIAKREAIASAKRRFAGNSLAIMVLGRIPRLDVATTL